MCCAWFVVGNASYCGVSATRLLMVACFQNDPSFFITCLLLTVYFFLSDDEGGTIKTTHGKKASQNDLYMRLGLLLGENARKTPSHQPSPSRPGSANQSHESCASFSSLASLEANTTASTNTSPVSTLTGKYIYSIYLNKNSTQSISIIKKTVKESYILGKKSYGKYK